jgi:uncharacterized membrane protein YhaH (DUF805 family)
MAKRNPYNSAGLSTKKHERVHLMVTPGPHRITKRQLFGVVASILMLAILWVTALANYAAEPKPLKAAPISQGEGVRATVRALSFNVATQTLEVEIKMKVTSGLIDKRGMLTQALILRAVDDEGVQKLQFEKGDPLTADSILMQMDGDTSLYPFDSYSSSFSLLAETMDDKGVIAPLTLSVGTAHAETGWYTRYSVTQGASDEAKITLIDMKREAFHIAFAILLAILMLLLSLMAIFVAYLCVTNRRASDPGLIGMMVALLFALPFVRSIMPGDPPIGNLVDVTVFVWAMLLATLSTILVMFAWLKQSQAALHHDREPEDSH